MEEEEESPATIEIQLNTNTADDYMELGFINAHIADRDDNDPTLTKVGGFPAFLQEGTPTPKCKFCGEKLQVLLQAYTPLLGPPDDRRQTFVLVCLSPQQKHPLEHTRFFAYRVKLAPSPELPISPDVVSNTTTTTTFTETPLFNISEANWSENNTVSSSSSSAIEPETLEQLEAKLIARDSSSFGSSSSKANEAKAPTKQTEPKSTNDTTSMDCSSSQSQQREEKEEEEGGCGFESLYIGSEFEPSGNAVVDTKLEKRALKLLHEYQRQQQQQQQGQKGGNNSSNEEVDVYEKAVGDRAFKKFQKRIARASAQVVRWCFGGNALQITDSFPLPKLNDIPKCPLCGSPRIFEMQILPTLLNFLRHPNKNTKASCGGGNKPPSSTPSTTTITVTTTSSNNSSMVISDICDFGNIVVYSCSSDCITPNGITEEFLFYHPSI